MVSSIPCFLLAVLPVALAVPHPMITPPPTLSDRSPPTRVRPYQQRRDIIDDAKSEIEGVGNYVGSLLGSFPSYVADGVPNFFQDFPTGSQVQKSLGISDGDLDAAPTQVLNIP